MDANIQISSRTSSYLIEDGSYFRLRNVQLTYTFGDSLNETLGISGGQLYLQGQNLLTVLIILVLTQKFKQLMIFS